VILPPVAENREVIPLAPEALQTLVSRFCSATASTAGRAKAFRVHRDQASRVKLTQPCSRRNNAHRLHRLTVIVNALQDIWFTCDDIWQGACTRPRHDQPSYGTRRTSRWASSCGPV